MKRMQIKDKSLESLKQVLAEVPNIKMYIDVEDEIASNFDVTISHFGDKEGPAVSLQITKKTDWRELGV